ncbi:hypothetical protein ACIBSW_02690 [Actinoplanes sp. NPDC049668]|uniref:hypothetical protein n=1 Tax=unclassified Actinoplanes TaxID=2626549 RepID=UPI0033B0CB72
MTANAAATARAARLGPVDAVAAVLITVSVLWRGWISDRGFLTTDDFPIIAQSDASGLTLGHLFAVYNNHLMPAGRLITFVTERLTGYEYRPYLVLMLLGQLAVSVALYRLLRLMLPAGWLLLVPLSLFLFNPMTLEVTAWWAVGINMLPMQLAMVLAVGAQVRYLRTGERRHLVWLGLAVAFGLLFFEKALLVVPLVFLVTLCLYAPGGPVRAVFTTVRRWWPSWVVLTGVTTAYLAAYVLMSSSGAATLRPPTSAGEVGTFFGQYYGETLAPGLVGGPWTWLDAADGTPLAAPTQPARWVSWGILAVLVLLTIWVRRWVAVRAWTLLALFSALAAGLIAATRLGSGLSGVAGLVPRYLADVLVVAAICVGVAVAGLRRLDAADEPAVAAAPARRYPQLVTAMAVGLVLLIASSLYSGRDFASDWQVKAGRDYLNTARADLAKAEPGTVFMDQPVPEGVVPGFSYPWNMQSRFFGPLAEGPVFVTEARKLSVFDEAGHIRPAWVDGVTARPGSLAGCGHRVTGARTVSIPLTKAVIDYWQVVRVGYLSDRDTTATIQVGNHPAVPFDVHRGLNAMFLLMLVEGDEVKLSVRDPAANLCTDEIEIGALVPQAAG